MGVKRNSLLIIVMNATMIVLSLLFIAPLLYIMSVSLSDERAFATYGFTIIPRMFSTLAYRYVFANSSIIWSAYGVSVAVTVLGTAFSLLVTAALGYAITRKDFALSTILTRFILIPLLFNGGLVATYMVITRILHIQNTLLVLILPYVVLPWHVFLIRGFMKDLPPAIFESAYIDGAGEVLVFMKLVLPLSKAALATVGLFTAFIYWNDWWLAMLYIENRRLIPIQYMLYTLMNNISFMTQNVGSSGAIIDTSQLPNESARMATCVLATVPMMLVFPFFQKYFVKGLVIGSVKG